MTADRTRVGLRLDPLDALFFRDGRPFDAASRVVGGLPNPQTIAGALRTALLARRGFDFRKLASLRHDAPHSDLKQALKKCLRDEADEWIIHTHFRGPWLAVSPPGLTPEPLLSQPAVLTQRKSGGWLRARPVNGVPGWADETVSPLWTDGEPDGKAESKLFTLTALKEFLAGQDEYDKARLFSPDEVYTFDDRVGIGIDAATLTSDDGLIYGLRLLVLRDRVREAKEFKGDRYHKAAVCLYTEVLPPGGAPPASEWFGGAVPLGGEGRYARAEIVRACDWPTPTEGGKSLWYLAQPAFLGTRYGGRPRPTKLDKVLRAAASGAGVAYSGWDVARNGPKPTRFAVPAGACYFTDGDVPDLTNESLCENDDDAVEGWGYALCGEWPREDKT